MQDINESQFVYVQAAQIICFAYSEFVAPWPAGHPEGCIWGKDPKMLFKMHFVIQGKIVFLKEQPLRVAFFYGKGIIIIPFKIINYVPC